MILKTLESIADTHFTQQSFSKMFPVAWFQTSWMLLTPSHGAKNSSHQATINKEQFGQLTNE